MQNLTDDQLKVDTIRQKGQSFANDVLKKVPKYFYEPPVVQRDMAVVYFVLNIFLGGLGTFVLGLKSKNKKLTTLALLQFVTSWLFFGWLWSIMYGYMMWKKAKQIVVRDAVEVIAPEKVGDGVVSPTAGKVKTK
mmetsp:Transcript_39643/g.61955  ORF Transcript_39643/g.61955 Transcript_39643/m.61955 type:complete len:135 (+) Transcript_39643:91-495(+)|eukprot:CAMPEP_0194560382 /NCGR_PEP_ID=MMETSP0292-20121207/1579_1 /TAXON_ID=39354 /ORGANISM="Heterosigma akashiwo, Strain CCMP2393" /LENGTH=134 /DNA_ID=CAMNT_0039408539 /DNA_START=104 /DNA_END=508 /DNA_ORIENTATION=-